MSVLFFVVIGKFMDFKVATIVGVVFTWLNFILGLIYAKCLNPNTKLIWPKTLDWISPTITVITLPLAFLGSEEFVLFYLGMIQTSIIVVTIITLALLKRPITREYFPVPPDEDERITEIVDKVLVINSFIVAGFFSIGILCSIIVAVLHLEVGMMFFLLYVIIPNVALLFAYPTLFYVGNIVFRRTARKKYGPDWLRILYGDEAAASAGDDDNVESSEKNSSSLTEPLLSSDDRANTEPTTETVV